MSLPETGPPELERWLRSLEERHLSDLRFPEVTRALRALSSGYVERRQTLSIRNPFDGAGKRAAYALYYGPLHFLTVRAILHRLPDGLSPVTHLADWGCGTGAAGAAWATAIAPQARVSAIDAHPWAIREAAATLHTFGLQADVRRGDVARTPLPASANAVVAGWVMNEVSTETRDAVLRRWLDLAARGTRVLIVEPIARRVSPWWPQWAARFEAAGGRADQWRFPVQLPEIVRRLDDASGMRHDELTARSLWLPGTAGAATDGEDVRANKSE
jgi:hypothetical protein